MTDKSDGPLNIALSTIRGEWERKTFLDYLKTEISRHETERSRPGWTVWALFAGGGALVSYFFSALDPVAPVTPSPRIDPEVVRES